MSVPGLTEDLDQILDIAAADILAFRGAKIYLTGGTGFVGTWILASIVHANLRLGAQITVDALSRDPAAFAARERGLTTAPGVVLLTGDATRPVKSESTYDAVIAAATPTASDIDTGGPIAAFRAMIDGYWNTIEAARRGGQVPLLFTSSGAVYGRQPPEVPLIDEDFPGAPNQLDPNSAYAEGKRACELLSALAVATDGPIVKLARLFAFLGPYLPTSQHFAAGNFIRDALRGGPIIVRGDGLAVRSYLYPVDMVAWLWAILARGSAARPYNVGSEAPVEIGDLARSVAHAAEGKIEIRILGSQSAAIRASRYVPSTARVRSELGVREIVDRDDAIVRTLKWNRSRGFAV